MNYWCDVKRRIGNKHTYLQPMSRRFPIEIDQIRDEKSLILFYVLELELNADTREL